VAAKLGILGQGPRFIFSRPLGPESPRLIFFEFQGPCGLYSLNENVITKEEAEKKVRAQILRTAEKKEEHKPCVQKLINLLEDTYFL